MMRLVHTGTQPILFGGKWYTSGDQFDASAEDELVRFFLAIGAVEAVKKQAPPLLPFNTMAEPKGKV